MKRLTILLITLCLCSGVFAKKMKCPYKWGKVSKEELQMKVYDKDTSANAVVLADVGSTTFTYDNDKGFCLVFSRYQRIKVLNKKGDFVADFKIPLYNSGSDKEEISSLKARTYNFVNGKIVKTKYKKDSRSLKTIDKNNKEYEFTMPEVKEGSIIEVKYKTRSPFIYNLQSWQFQFGIPVVWSEYTVGIPEYFHYNPSMFGFNKLTNRETYQRQESFSYNYRSSPQAGGRIETYKGTEEYKTNYTRMIMCEIPAMKKEKYTTTLRNYLSKIKYELSFTNYPWSTMKSYSNTWESINQKLLNNENLGHRLKYTGFLSNDTKEITKNCKSDNERMEKIFEFIKSKMKWDEYNSKYSDGLKKAYKKESGNSADINLLLIAMLRKAGISSDPVILATRGYGLVHPSHASMTSFNYLIALARIDGKEYYMDATEKHIPINILPFRCLNDGKARIISKSHKGWANIPLNKFYSERNHIEISLEKNGDIAGKYNSSKSGYAALSFRSKYIEKKDPEDEYIKNFEKNVSGITIDSANISDIKDVNKRISITTAFTLSSEESSENVIYINPLLFEQIKDNPFKNKKRLYPVDFGYKSNIMNVVRIKIPEGYKVESVPENKALSLPEKSGRFIYNISLSNGMINLTTILKITKKTFSPQDYEALRMFYNLIVEKNTEKVVIKKV